MMTLAFKYIKNLSTNSLVGGNVQSRIEEGEEEKYRAIMCSLWASQLVLVVKNLSANAGDL